MRRLLAVVLLVAAAAVLGRLLCDAGSERTVVGVRGLSDARRHGDRLHSYSPLTGLSDERTASGRNSVAAASLYSDAYAPC